MTLWKNHVPHINDLAKFNQNTLKSARERRNRLQRERRARQCIELTEPQERSNRLCRERQTVPQATTHAQPFLINDALQLFRELVEPFETPQEQSNRLRRERRTV